MALTEAICKTLCRQDGYDPDQLVCMGMPQFFQQGMIAGYLIPNALTQMPAWWSYHRIVDEVIRQIEKQQ